MAIENKRPPALPAGRRYHSVEALMQGEAVSQDVRTKVASVRVTWWDSIKFFREFADNNRGTMNIMSEALRKRTGEEKNWRVMLDLWTNRDDNRRVEPKYSTGIIILEEATRVVEEITAQKLVIESVK